MTTSWEVFFEKGFVLNFWKKFVWMVEMDVWNGWFRRYDNKLGSFFWKRFCLELLNFFCFEEENGWDVWNGRFRRRYDNKLGKKNQKGFVLNFWEKFCLKGLWTNFNLHIHKTTYTSDTTSIRLLDIHYFLLLTFSSKPPIPDIPSFKQIFVWKVQDKSFFKKNFPTCCHTFFETSHSRHPFLQTIFFKKFNTNPFLICFSQLYFLSSINLDEYF